MTDRSNGRECVALAALLLAGCGVIQVANEPPKTAASPTRTEPCIEHMMRAAAVGPTASDTGFDARSRQAQADAAMQEYYACVARDAASRKE